MIDINKFKENRQKIYDALKGGKLALAGGETTQRYDSDMDERFVQESNFLYATGCKLADCLVLLDGETRKIHLFVPHLPESYAVWLGDIEPLTSIKERLQVDEISVTDDFGAAVKGMTGILTTKLSSAILSKYASETEFVVEADNLLAECRVHKTEYEKELVKKSCDALTEVFKTVMPMAKPGVKEHVLQAAIEFEGRKRECHFVSFYAIPAAAHSATKLHYIAMDQEIKSGQTFLLDGGIQYEGYSSDVTRTFPIDGTFTEDQRALYEVVLEANKECIKMVMPGVEWKDCHAKCLEILAKGLIRLGLVKGDLQAVLDADIPALFQPHGLGHMLGLDVHDVGGFPEGRTKLTRPGYCNLRANRVLEEDMMVTVEPGCYFIKALLEPAFKDESKKDFLNEEVIRRYWAAIPGIRIEDDIIVSKEGPINMTSGIPKEADDLAKLLA